MMMKTSKRFMTRETTTKMWRSNTRRNKG